MPDVSKPSELACERPDVLVRSSLETAAWVHRQGGLFIHNSASGTGLMSGATFGRLAGRSEAAFVREQMLQAAAVRERC